MATKGSLLTIGGWGEPLEKKKPLSDITNTYSVPETPRTFNSVLDEEDISLEEVPTAPLKVDIKSTKSTKPIGKRLQFEDENSLQNIAKTSCLKSSARKQLMAMATEEEEVAAPPPVITKPERSRKRFNITGNKDKEQNIKVVTFSRICQFK
jgi:hypothetical protein